MSETLSNSSHLHCSAFLDTKDNSATFYSIGDSNKLLPTPTYRIVFSAGSENSSLTLFVDDESTEESTNWLQFVLLKKLQNWSDSCGKEELNQNVESHQLIDSEAYNETYSELKEKYGRKLEENWNESTDPKKFIYEDIAIASYLIILWRQERQSSEQLQSFVDLGCGNGLLVYILSQEGHKGYGIDLRRRKIWDQFPDTTDLREMAVVPSNENLFPDVDWIIGNHSDELSPWIPVISARSSYNSRYFLLPCCAYEFSGAKFQRKGSKSQYLSFVDYLKIVSDVCGFKDTKVDRLKIPSTKRICLVGSTRNYNVSEFHEQCQKIQKFINESSRSQDTPSSQSWSDTFKPREKLQAVKNCSQIDRRLAETIVKRIFEHLLARKESFTDDYPSWNIGGAMRIPEAVELVSPEELKQLKSECGGLQTLLRNKHQIFHTVGGFVKIRVPKKMSEMVFSQNSLKRNSIKSSACYFFQNHPSSCPLDDNNCSYIH